MMEGPQYLCCLL